MPFLWARCVKNGSIYNGEPEYWRLSQDCDTGEIIALHMGNRSRRCVCTGWQQVPTPPVCPLSHGPMVSQSRHVSRQTSSHCR